MSVSITVVAKFTPEPGMGSRVIEAFRVSAPLSMLNGSGRMSESVRIKPISVLTAQRRLTSLNRYIATSCVALEAKCPVFAVLSR